MKIYIICLNIIFLALSAQAGQVCKHEIAIENATFSNGSTDSDMLSKNTAKFLKAQNLDKDCIDLRVLDQSSRSSSEKITFRRASVGLLLTQPLSSENITLLNKTLCMSAGEKCQAKTNFTCKQTSELSFRHDFPGDAHDHDKPIEWNSAAVGNPSRMPRFSAACDTGVRKDSWNDTASTPESRELIKSAGLDITKIRSLSLRAGQSTFWTFGFPDHERDNQVDSGEVDKGATGKTNIGN